MWFRMATVAILAVSVVGLGVAETPKIYSRAAPPDKAALDRLNLKMEWSIYLPVNGQRDSIESVQTFDDQIFVQTRTGLLAAIDARTGKIQWQTSLGNGGYANVYPVAVNANFVYAAHVTRLYSFYRYSGVAEFSTDLGTPPTAGLAADSEAIYATLATRPNSAGVERIARFDIPTPIEMPDASVKAVKEFDKGKRMTNPVDELGKRYPIATGTPPRNDSVLESRSSGSRREVPVGGMSGSKTPSLAAVTRIGPPYFREGGATAPSLVVMRSLRQPYRLKGETAAITQQTPSISTIPPSVAAALALGDLRPQGIKPRLRWEYGMTHGLAFRLTMTPKRIWAVTEDRGFVALNKLTKKVEVSGKMFEQIAAAPAEAGTIGYVPLGDGTLLAVDLAAGNQLGGIITLWQANAGGLMNRTPVVTDDAVFAAGDNSGVVRIQRNTGIVDWRTDRASDRVVGVNKDFLYVQNRQGRLQIYDVKRANSRSVLGISAPLSSIDMSTFNIPIVNTVSDRIYFAADNGLLICLRDASRKYDAPVRMAPKADVDVPPPEADAMKKDAMPPPKEEPKKEEPKKDKKDKKQD
ncbi:MAG TPA: PQQ-binding-like beta-propeller repeat protein [Urbifossiella sp.]|nr:PQQ-binding-like beta-propeller repeat protein [Urbifossiella sp.]